MEQAEREVIAKDLGPNNKVSFPFMFYTVTGHSRNSLKGQCHEMDIFFEGLLISTSCVCVDGFQGLSKAFHYHTLYNCYLFICFFENCTY